MPFGETKVYFDGSHYIAIPHTTRSAKERVIISEEVIAVIETQPKQNTESASSKSEDAQKLLETNDNLTEESTNQNYKEQTDENATHVKNEQLVTRKELFNRLYNESINQSRAIRRKTIISAMRPYFASEERTVEYVDKHIERRIRNIICRRIRCVRKANLQDFNYFVTFTYDDKLHAETSFKKKLKGCLGHLASRKSWKYIGVWERSPEKKRLHFHGIFDIPEGTMPGLLFEKNDYNFNIHKRQTTTQNTYFNENFGRSDFETIDDKTKLGHSIAYLMKYIEKTGERLIYSKGLPQFFISDIMDEDIVCTIGMEDKKLLLFDDFTCWDEGTLIGTVSKETIKQLRTSN